MTTLAEDSIKISYENMIEMFPHFLVMSKCHPLVSKNDEYKFETYFTSEQISFAKNIAEAFEFNLSSLTKTFMHILDLAEKDEKIKLEPFVIQRCSSNKEISELIKELQIDSKDFMKRFRNYTNETFVPTQLEPGSPEEDELLNDMSKEFSKNEIMVAFKMIYDRIPQKFQR